MRRTLVVLVLLCLTIQALWATQKSEIKAHIDGMIAKLDGDINIGVKVLDLSNNQVLYQRNPERAYTPASVLKIFTDAAALIDLGPDFHFNTELLTEARSINKGRLKGSLYLKFNGDPSLTHQDISTLLDHLKRYAIEKIEGDIIVVGPKFGSQPYAPGWMLEDTVFSYASPVLPIIVDKNELSLRIDPAASIGAPARLSLNDPSHSVKLINRVTTSDAKSCRIRYHMNKSNQLKVEGCIGSKRLSRQKDIAIKNPSLYLKRWLEKELHQQGLSYTGKIVSGKLARQTKSLAVHHSPPLSRLIIDTLKPSDNLYADSIYLTVAEHFFKKAVSWRSAAVAVKRILHRYARLNMKQAVIVDGSGLSRYNLVTPAQTVALLSYLYSEFPISYEFITALPVSGRDGTLQKRLLAGEARGFVRAKTGTMLGVVSLAGYLPSADHHVLAFSILINGIPGESHASLSPYRHLADALCDYFLHLDIKKAPLVGKPQYKKQTLAHQKSLSYLNRMTAKKRRINRLELSLRKSLNQFGVEISRSADGIQLILPRVSVKKKSVQAKRDKKVIAQLAKAIKPYSMWVFVQSKNASWNKRVRRKLANPVLYSNAGDVDDYRISLLMQPSTANL